MPTSVNAQSISPRPPPPRRQRSPAEVGDGASTTATRPSEQEVVAKLNALVAKRRAGEPIQLDFKQCVELGKDLESLDPKQTHRHLHQAFEPLLQAPADTESEGIGARTARAMFVARLQLERARPPSPPSPLQAEEAEPAAEGGSLRSAVATGLSAPPASFDARGANEPRDGYAEWLSDSGAHARIEALFHDPEAEPMLRRRMRACAHPLPPTRPLAVFVPQALRYGEKATVERMSLLAEPPADARVRKAARTWWRPVLGTDERPDEQPLREEIIRFAEAAYEEARKKADCDPVHDGLGLASQLMRFAARTPGRRSSPAMTPLRTARYLAMQEVAAEWQFGPAMSFALGMFGLTFPPSLATREIARIARAGLRLADDLKVSELNQRLWLCRCMGWVETVDKCRANWDELMPILRAYFQTVQPMEPLVSQLWFPEAQDMLAGLDWLLSSEAGERGTKSFVLGPWPAGCGLQTALLITHIARVPVDLRAVVLQHMHALRGPGGAFAQPPPNSEVLQARRALAQMYQAISLALGGCPIGSTLPPIEGKEVRHTIVGARFRTIAGEVVDMFGDAKNTAALRVCNAEMLLAGYSDMEASLILMALSTSPIASSAAIAFEVMRALQQVSDADDTPEEEDVYQRPDVFECLIASALPATLNTLHAVVAGYFHLWARPPARAKCASYTERLKQFRSLLVRGKELEAVDRNELYEIVARLVAAGAATWEVAAFTPQLVACTPVQLSRLRRAAQSQPDILPLFIRNDPMRIRFNAIVDTAAYFKAKQLPVLPTSAPPRPVTSLTAAKTILDDCRTTFSTWTQLRRRLEQHSVHPVAAGEVASFEGTVDALQKWLEHEAEWTDGNGRCTCVQMTMADAWQRYKATHSAPLPLPWKMTSNDRHVLSVLMALLSITATYDPTPEGRGEIAEQIRARLPYFSHASS